MYSSNTFFAASSAFSFPMIAESLGIHISLKLSFSWSSSSLIRLVVEVFVRKNRGYIEGQTDRVNEFRIAYFSEICSKKEIGFEKNRI
jgi:hypothetical protein